MLSNPEPDSIPTQNRVFQLGAALLFYGAIIFHSGRLLDLNPTQMVLPYYSLRADKCLNICMLNWDTESIRGNWPLQFSEAPIFFPNQYARFYTDHLYAHMIYAMPISLFIKSPIWIYNLTYELNRLTIAFAIFLLCLWITKSFAASLISGTLLLLGWNFGQLQNTGLGWSILTIFVFLMHLKKPEWKLVPWLVIFGILSGLSSGYLAFFTPIAVLILLVTQIVYQKSLPRRHYWLQMGTALILISLAL